MNQDNLFCEYSNCSLPIAFFGFKNSSKVKSCEEHLALLSRKGISLYPISAFHFVETPEDLPLYETRKRLVDVAMGNLGMWESGCKRELRTALTLLEESETQTLKLVANCFKEGKAVVQQRYDEISAKLKEIQLRLHEFLSSKKATMHIDIEPICKEIPLSPKLLRFALCDVTLPIANAILNSWKLPSDKMFRFLDVVQRKKIIDELLRSVDKDKLLNPEFSLESIQYANSLGYEGSDNAILEAIKAKHRETYKTQISLFHFHHDEETIMRASAAYFLEAESAKAEFRYDACLQLLDKSWSILATNNIADSNRVQVGLLLGEVLCLHFSKFSDAELVLRTTLEIESRSNPKSHTALQLYTWIALNYYYSDRLSDAETACATTLQTFQDCEQSAEDRWLVVYHFFISKWWQGKTDEAERLAEEWKTKLGGMIESKLVKILKVMIDALVARRKNDVPECERLRVKAKVSLEKRFPTSFLAASNLSHLAWLYKAENRVELAKSTFASAETIFSVHYPTSLGAANNLHNFGVLLFSLNDRDSAEKKYIASQKVYASYFPRSNQTANNLYSLGLAQEEKDRLKAAIESVTTAMEIWRGNGAEDEIKMGEPVLARLKESAGCLLA